MDFFISPLALYHTNFAPSSSPFFIVIADWSTTSTSPATCLLLSTFVTLSFSYAFRQYSSCSSLPSLRQHFAKDVYIFYVSPNCITRFPLSHYREGHLSCCSCSVPSFQSPAFFCLPSFPRLVLRHIVRFPCPFRTDFFSLPYGLHRLLLRHPPPRQSFPSPDFLHHVPSFSHFCIALCFRFFNHIILLRGLHARLLHQRPACHAAPTVLACIRHPCFVRCLRFIFSIAKVQLLIYDSLDMFRSHYHHVCHGHHFHRFQ